MRVAGDVDGCLDVVRVLERCAASVQSARDEVDQPVPFSWAGPAALRWQDQFVRRTGYEDATAWRVQSAAHALRAFADDLADLQARARRLSAEAAQAGLVLDDAGRIAPVPPCLDPDAQAEHQRRTQVRTEVLHGVRALQADRDALHARLVRALGQDVLRPSGPPRPSPAPSPWRPGLGDAPSAALATARTALHDVGSEGLRLAGRAAGSTLVGAAVTGTVELVDGEDPVDAALTTAVVTAGASSGGALVVAGVSALAAPVAVPVALGVAAVAVGGLVGGYVADRLWDAHGQDVKRAGGRLLSSARLPWVDRPSQGRRRR